MLPEQVDECFRNYKEYSARCEFLFHEIEDMKKTVDKMKQQAIDDAVSIASPALTGMPHGHSISKPTENVAVKFADGYVPQHIADAEEEIRQKHEEYRAKYSTVLFVEAWMKALNARENLIVRGKLIDGLFWRELVTMYRNAFGEEYTKHGLKRILDAALEKIYRVAK